MGQGVENILARMDRGGQRVPVRNWMHKFAQHVAPITVHTGNSHYHTLTAPRQ